MDADGQIESSGNLNDDRATSGCAQPIAIVGMACRFPGAPDIASFWQLLEAGGNAVSEGVPGSGDGRIGELFPNADIQSEACRFGAYLDRIDLFDAAFFRISPVEAQLLDPQQRLMLETSWKAIEDAGMDPDRLKGSRTGVYAGISNHDYRSLILGGTEITEPAASLYAVSGTSFNTAIGRVAFALGLEGPAMALDTACSSSLVAIHQAVSGLQRGEADLALTGGVHLIVSGRLSELRGKAGMLAPDGQCKTFDAAANGYVRGEGCGIVVLKRLREAEADGDRIWGVIRGSAVNQDGASPGLTVPNGASQERVIGEALSDAGLSPSEVDYLEAHGTGTTVGDPIELEAAAAAYGNGRAADRPLLIGSVKTNIGHLEPAAGVAALIKVALAMNHGVIPRHLNFREPNPALDWDRMPLRVTAEQTAWPSHSERVPTAGISGFGWSGTNAHLVVEAYNTEAEGRAGVEHRQWPSGSRMRVAATLAGEAAVQARGSDAAADRETRVLPLSGKSNEALQGLAGRYLDWLDERATEPGDAGAAQSMLADMAWTAGVGRSHFAHRKGIVFGDVSSLREELRALADSGAANDAQAPSRVAFLYTGQGSHWVGMGEKLHETEPVFRAVLDRCDAVMRKERGGSLLDVMFGRSGDLSNQAWTQAAIFSLECALTALWSSLGVRPHVVLGHSFGEHAAAQAAGVFDLEEGVHFAAARGELTAALPQGGAMAAIFADVPQVETAIDELNARSDEMGLCIAAYNGAHQVVSGLENDVTEISERFLARDVRVNRLATGNAFHSPMVDPMLDGLENVVADLDISSPSLTLVSNVTGRVLESDERMDGAYWRRHSREPVAFSRSMETLARLGVDLIIEVGPHSVLGSMATMAWPEAAGSAPPPIALSSLLRPSSRVSQAEADRAFTVAAARAYESGLPISFSGLFAGEERRRIALPGYPFQRKSHWVKATRRRPGAGHPLLGGRHESASGEVAFDTEVFPSDPAWLEDHRVFDRLVAPGALYGAMAVSAAFAEGAGTDALEDVQLHNPLIFADEDDGDGAGESGRRMQVLIDESGDAQRIRILSRGDSGDDWTLHAEGRLSADAGGPRAEAPPDLDGLRNGLSPQDVAALYRAKAGVGIDHGPSFRTLEAVWSGAGEALGEVALPAGIDPGGIEIHPLLLDGCFQIMAAAREQAGTWEGVTYLPFGWERLWLAGPLPERVLCHARMSADSRTPSPDAESEPPEVLTGDLRIYDPSGTLLCELDGYTVKRATREALLSAVEGLDELLYEVVWRDGVLAPGMPSADFLPYPSDVAPRSKPFSLYLAAEGVGVEDEAALQADLERLSWAYALSALEELGWQRRTGAGVDPEALRQELKVLPEHARLLRRILEILARSGVLEAADEGFVVAVGAEDALPEEMPHDPDEHATGMAGRYPHGTNEIGLIRRCAGALAEVLRGREDPLSLLFGDAEPQAADLYRRAPVWRAANQMLGEVVQTLAAGLPEGRRLRVLEVGAGIGSATECVLPGLPAGRFDYTYTDISAGFFADAEARFDQADAPIEYRVLDIEKEPAAQGYGAHAYDLVIAANVLHATQYLDQTLAHCRELLAPAGQLVALENQRGRGWMDLIFGQLDGWWRFADQYRSDHALAGPDVWRRALADVGFGEVEILGVDESESAGLPDRGVIVAQGPAEVLLPPAAWVLAGDRGGVATALAAQLAARNQTVVLAGAESTETEESAHEANGVVRSTLEMERRESWRSLLEGLPGDVPLGGIVHLAALDGHGAAATTEEMGEDARQAAASALALTQGVIDADLTPAQGVWFVTRGAQILERERAGQLGGATLWGFGRVVAREAAHLNPKMIDLDPDAELPADFTEELLFPDPETQIAYRTGRRRVARLVRTEARLALPEGSDWLLAPAGGGSLQELQVQPLPARSLEPGEVRVAVEARGLNFLDVFRGMGLVGEGLMGEEMCGRIVEVGPGTSTVSAGDRVVGLAFGTFGPEVVTREELVALAPAGIPVASLATMPTVFVTTALSFDIADLKAGERVLIHAAAGGVGLAAVQLAQAAGAEVFATASASKQAYLRSLGVTQIFDSRTTNFGGEILEATDGAGVDVVLNSLTGEGFIDASLACLRKGGRFVELARRDILSEEEMAAVRPDVAYAILELDVLKEQDPARPGAALRNIMERLEAGELKPLIHSRWPLAEAGAAMEYMRDARHIGKIVLTRPPLVDGRLRQDRTYLVTGGLGGIGCALAGWLAERGAGAIVLNGRRAPDPEAEETIAALRERGVTVRVELADVTDAGAVDAMFERIKGELPPLGGVIHSVGVLSDASLANQSRERFEQVLRPKVLGAWHLHRSTADCDLDLFVLFSSVAGILGNPGQANHAAANTFLDQLAAHRRALGLPGQAIAWGAWSGLGEAEEQRERIARRREAAGTGWFSPEQGLRVFDRLLREDPTTSVVLAADWSVFGEAVEGRASLFEDLLPAAEDASEDASGASEDLLSMLEVTPAAGREELFVSFLQQEVQAVLRLPAAPAPAVGFFDLGIDSLMAVELRNRLNRAFAGHYVAPNTLVFDYPDIASLAGHLVGELGEIESAPTPAPEAQPEPERVPTPPREENGVAIVGMACRFPGASDVMEFWKQLDAGANAVTDGRWNSGTTGNCAEELTGGFNVYRSGGFVDGIDGFDARFFRIAPIEARMMDPQQRMLLETSWQALEDAGIDPGRLRGSRTGVYSGIAASEYRDLMAGGDHDISYLGTSASMTVGRVAFVLGLEGPAIPVELNCASSLVAVHQAVTGLREGEVDLALVGGVNAVLSPRLTREMAEMGMLSPEGRCKAFDGSANGFVRGDGCGMVVLKRLADAEADGDRIWGVVRGSAVNQNGAAAGPTVPNGPAQERLIEAALARAGIAPSDVDYLEAHGAGSAMGDSIELQAAAAVYGREREADRPLLVGSVKTNVGHLETVAGIAGLIKTVLAMKHGMIPRHLHFRDPNPNLDWSQLPVRVTSEATGWPHHPDRPSRAGVSAFGISGSNAHVVVEGYGDPAGGSPDSGLLSAGSAQRVSISLPEPVADLPLPEDGRLQKRQTRFLPLSGKAEGALRELAARYAAWLDEETYSHADQTELLADMAWTAGVGRSHFDYRAGVAFNDVASLREGLETVALGEGGLVPVTSAKVAFVYAGRDSHQAGMGRSLYETEPVVQMILDRCDEVFRDMRGAPLLEVLIRPAESDDALEDPDRTQPAIYALHCALTELWSSVGIRPNVVLGRDIGELAAARAAGVISLEEGLRIAASRDGEAPLEKSATAPPTVDMISGATGRFVDPGDAREGEYWRRQMNEPARLNRCFETLVETGVNVVIEIGPDAVNGSDSAGARPESVNGGEAPVVLSSLPRPSGDDAAACCDRFIEAVAGAYEAGLAVSFDGLFSGERRRRVSLPGYPFQRRRHWI